MARILLGQLGSNGDCLYATILARQIKKDVPDCHLTWAISSLCRPMIEHNPDVDEIWEVPVASRRDQQFTWQTFESEALRLLARHHFDRHHGADPLRSVTHRAGNRTRRRFRA
jgi:ADP-heptose:LPS heptosyltransferase